MQHARIVLSLVLSMAPAWAGAPMRAGGNPLRWKDGKVTVRVSRTVHAEAGELGVDRRDSAAAVHTAVWEAVRAWTAPGRAKVEVDFGFTDQTRHTGAESLVTFTDPVPFDTGLCNKDSFVACALLTYGESGEIQAATIAFNPYKKHSVSGIENTHDIGLIMLHELGHVFGLDHSAVLDSVLLPQTETDPGSSPVRQFAVRAVSEDDLNSLASLYPPDEPASTAVEGTISRPGAHVFAVEASSGRVMHGAVSDGAGKFRLLVAPGEYRLAAEPLDGPVVAGQMMSRIEAAAEAFPSTLFSQSIVVSLGETRAVELVLPEGVARVNADSIGLINGGAYWGGPRVAVSRGGKPHSLAITRTPLSGVGTFELPAVLQAAGAISSPSAVPQLVRQTVAAAPEGRTGSYLLAYRHPDGLVLFPGGIRVTAGPHVTEVSPLQRGQRATVRGKDLAAVAAAAVMPPWEDAALPTQLGEVSVRVGERFVPLVSVSPGEIVFEAPAWLAAGDVRLWVVAGTQVESEAVTVRVE